MGRPSEGRESQKTCLENGDLSPRTRDKSTDLADKLGIPGSINFGPGIFFASDLILERIIEVKNEVE